MVYLLSHVWFDAERKKELQMSNTSPETQNLSKYSASSADTNPQRGGPGRAVLRSAFPWCLHSCHTEPYEWMQCHVHTHLPACRERASFMTHWHFDPLQFRSSNCLFSSPLLATVCQRAPFASGCSLHQTFTCEVKVTHATILANSETNILHATCQMQKGIMLTFSFSMFCSPFISFLSHWGLHLGPWEAPGSQDQPSEGQGINHRWRWWDWTVLWAGFSLVHCPQSPSPPLRSKQ